SVLPQFHNNLQRIDVNRACLYTSIAGGTGPEFLSGDIVVQKTLLIGLEGSVLIDVFPYFGQPIAGIHHDFSRRKKLAGHISRTNRCAASALGASISVEKTFPAQVAYIF